MEITIQELNSLDKSLYQIIDIRSEAEINHGAIPGAIAASFDNIKGNPNIDFNKKLVICCSHGKKSKEVVEELVSEDINAVSLKGGYPAWLVNHISMEMEQSTASNENESEADANVQATTGKKKKKEPTTICEKAEQSLRKKFKKTIWSKFTKAINEYELVKEGDCIAVCISGGKDSMLMAKLFQELKRHNKFEFEVKFLVMNPGYNEYNLEIIKQNAKNLEVPITIYNSDIFDSVFNVEKSPCYLCARMRRGHLYAYAKEMGCNKIALGHHYDDVIETILMGMLYGAQVQTMMPKLHSTNFEGMELIRPMYLIREDDIKHWRDYNELHFIQCACRFTSTCSMDGENEETKSKRLATKRLIREMKKTNPYVESNIFRSVENVSLNTVIAYKDDEGKHHFLDTYDEK